MKLKKYNKIDKSKERLIELAEMRLHDVRHSMEGYSSSSGNLTCFFDTNASITYNIEKGIFTKITQSTYIEEEGRIERKEIDITEKGWTL
jgi:hypothetical protein